MVAPRGYGRDDLDWDVSRRLAAVSGGRFTRFTTAQGLPSNIICQVLDDGAGQLWMGSYGRHLSRGEVRSHATAVEAIPLVSYGQSDGLPTLECSGNYQPSAWKGSNGRLWFATGKGVVSVDPKEPRSSARRPKRSSRSSASISRC